MIRLILTTRSNPGVGVLLDVARPDNASPPGVVRHHDDLYVIDPQTNALTLGPPPNTARYFRCDDVLGSDAPSVIEIHPFKDEDERRALGFPEPIETK